MRDAETSDRTRWPRLCTPDDHGFETARHTVCSTFDGAVRWWLGVWELAGEHYAAGRSYGDAYPDDTATGDEMMAQADRWAEQCRTELAKLEAHDAARFATIKTTIADEGPFWALDWAAP